MRTERDGANVRIFPPAVPIAAVALGALLQHLVPIGTAHWFGSPLRQLLGGGLVIGSIVGLGAWSVVLFRRGGQSENPWKPTTHIERRGPYRLTRNPMYLQMVLICVGVAILFSNLWILLLVPLAVLALQHLVIRPEERYLETKFGEVYLDYKRRVRRWL